mmetsp:Transcript_33261/g.74420  ORF Transcript_33261/g.74420 Transcript_33261/m.74420 type:complete len:221 (-) Transcript_33261:11-673(-)
MSGALARLSGEGSTPLPFASRHEALAGLPYPPRKHGPLPHRDNDLEVLKLGLQPFGRIQGQVLRLALPPLSPGGVIVDDVSQEAGILARAGGHRPRGLRASGARAPLAAARPHRAGGGSAHLRHRHLRPLRHPNCPRQKHIRLLLGGLAPLGRGRPHWLALRRSFRLGQLCGASIKQQSWVLNLFHLLHLHLAGLAGLDCAASGRLVGIFLLGSTTSHAI